MLQLIYFQFRAELMTQLKVIYELYELAFALDAPGCVIN